MSLSALQRDFAAWLADPAGTDPARFGLADPRGLEVYQNNYRGQLLACLEASYPLTLAWLGEGEFHAAAAAHIDTTPPHSWTLDEYAEGFPGTLVARFGDDPEVADLARIELALGNAFVAPDDVALAPGELAAIDWERARLRLIASAAYVSLGSNADAIWLALDAGEAPPAAAIAGPDAHLIVWRAGFACRFQRLDEAGQAIAPLLAGGIGFEAICGEFTRTCGEADGIARAGAWLAEWSAAGLLALA